MVSDSLSVDKSTDERGEGTAPVPLSRYEDIFWQKFPYYLSIGMTEAQYWEGDCVLPKYYRKAEELRKERVNQEAWIQGMYTYDAIARLSPILHAFAKKGTKAKPYLDEPYSISKKMAEEAQTKKDRQKSQKGIQYMEALMAANNKRYKERK